VLHLKCNPVRSNIIDAREVFGDRRRDALVRRLNVELTAFEHKCSDMPRTFIDMFEAVAWARHNPRSAIHHILFMDDRLPDPVYVSRLAKLLYGPFPRVSQPLDVA
jgi:hypothetical protein